MPRVGTLAWEAAGGPPLTVTQRSAALIGAAGVVLAHWFGGMLRIAKPAAHRSRGMGPTR